jgi:hypothetical protein
VQMFLPVPDTEWLDGAYVAYLYNLTQAAAPPHTRLARPTPALAVPPPVPLPLPLPLPVPSPYRALPCPIFYSAPLAPTALRPWSSPNQAAFLLLLRCRSRPRLRVDTLAALQQRPCADHNRFGRPAGPLPPQLSEFGIRLISLSAAQVHDFITDVMDNYFGLEVRRSS